MATPLESWAAERVGTPFVEKGRTRAGYDCAGFLLAAYREVFGLELPTFTERYAGIQDRQGIARAIDEQRDLWRGVPAGHERPGDAILLRVYGLPIHVGLVLGRRRFAVWPMTSAGGPTVPTRLGIHFGTFDPKSMRT